jgi:hypothetical protein
MLKWARENDCPWSVVTSWYAAEHGHLEVLKWAREHRAARGMKTRASYAADGGHLVTLKWRAENDCPVERG